MESSPGIPSREPAVAADARPRPPARRRTAFDVIFGIALPAVCLLLDPGVFRRSPGWDPMPLRFQGHAIAAYTSILPGALLLAAWLGWKRAPLFFAGPLLFGGLVALAIGVVLLPISLPAAIVLIGLLGLVPFGTALAFFRNGIRAFQAACAGRSPWVVAAVTLTMGAATGALPVAAQLTLNGRTRAALDAALADDPKREAEAIAALKPFGWLADRQRFQDAALASKNSGVQQRLARVWHAATGEDLHLETNPD